jgi:hypothetical protein
LKRPTASSIFRWCSSCRPPGPTPSGPLGYRGGAIFHISHALVYLGRQLLEALHRRKDGLVPGRHFHGAAADAGRDVVHGFQGFQDLDRALFLLDHGPAHFLHEAAGRPDPFRHAREGGLRVPGRRNHVLYGLLHLDQFRADIPRLFCGRFGEPPDFVGDDGEALSRFPRVRRFDGGVHGQQVRLRRDRGDGLVGLQQGARTLHDQGDAGASRLRTDLPSSAATPSSLNCDVIFSIDAVTDPMLPIICSIEADASVTLDA